MTSNISHVLYRLAEDTHTLLHRLLVANSDFANCSDTFLDEFRIHLIDILSQLLKHRLVVLVIDDSCKNFAEFQDKYIFSFLT
jgi:hypothetical protein